MSAAEVVVVGSANRDEIAALPAIPAPGETVLATGREQRSGGKGLNQAVAAARAGARTLLVAAVGDDQAGRLLVEDAAAAGVGTDLVRHLSGPSGTAWIMVRDDGENAIVVDGGANRSLTDLSEADLAAISAARVVVAQLEVPLSAVTQAAAAARDAGRTTVLNAAPARELPPDLLRLVDVLVVNETEARQLSGRTEPGEAADLLLDLVGAVVVTLGADGALVVDRHGRRSVSGVAAEVVDTTGAGDTFTGYLAATVAAGGDLDAAAARAVVAGALAVETAGAVPSIPTAEQVEHRLSQRGAR